MSTEANTLLGRVLLFKAVRSSRENLKTFNMKCFKLGIAL